MIHIRSILTACLFAAGLTKTAAGEELAAATNNRVTLTTSPNPAIFGQPVTMTISYTPTTATGPAIFYYERTMLGIVPVSNGSASFTTVMLPAGVSNVRAKLQVAGTMRTGSNRLSQTVKTNPGSGFAAPLIIPVGGAPGRMAVGDLNGDGLQDIAVVTTGAVVVLLSNGNGAFTMASYPAPNPTSVAIGDFNADGHPDLAVSDNGMLSTHVNVFLNAGNGTFGAFTSADAKGSRPFAVVTSDFNEDGKADIGVVYSNDNRVGLLIGNGDGTFKSPKFTTLPVSGASSLTVADFNEDNKTDLAVTFAAPNPIAVLLMHSTAAFASPVMIGSGLSPGDSATGDFNGDGNPDIVTADGSGDTVSTLLNLGAGIFGGSTAFSLGAGSAPGAVAVGDFNGDGKLDVASACSGNNSVAILLGNGDGTLQAPVNYATGPAPSAIVVGDFNGDGIQDLAVANSGDGTVAIYLGLP